MMYNARVTELLTLSTYPYSFWKLDVSILPSFQMAMETDSVSRKLCSWEYKMMDVFWHVSQIIPSLTHLPLSYNIPGDLV
jgi:hypothetical protein